MIVITVTQGIAILPFQRSWRETLGVETWRIWLDLLCAVVSFTLISILLLSSRKPRDHGWVVPVAAIFFGAGSVLSGLWPVAAVMLGMQRRAKDLVWAVVAALAGYFIPLCLPGGGMVYGLSLGMPLGMWDLVRSTIAMVSCVVVCVLLGMNFGAHEELMQSVTRAADLARQTQEARVAQGRAEERAHISREMHDSLAHRLSLLSLHAGVLETRKDLDAGTVRQIAGSIRSVAGEAGRDLRQILTVLHDDGTGDGSRAVWADVEQVIVREREAGQDLKINEAPQWRDSFSRAGAAVRHGVLRTVQEALTNARSHGRGGPVELSFDVDPFISALVVGCANACAPGRVQDSRERAADGHGLGLPGLSERLRLLGGSLTTSRERECFVVRAVLPTGASADEESSDGA